MAILLLVILVYLAAVAETALVPLLRVGHTTPDLMALLAVVLALRWRNRYGFLGSGAIALVGDLISPGRVGLGAAWMLLLAFGLGRFQRRARLRHPAGQTAAVLLSVACWAGALGLSCRLLGPVEAGIATILCRAVYTGAYTAAVGLPALMVLGWWDERTAPAPLERYPGASRGKHLHLET